MFVLSGVVRILWTSADIPSALEQIGQSNISLFDVSVIDEATVKFSIPKTDLKGLVKISNRRGERFEIQSRKGIIWVLLSLRQRPILIVGTVFLLILALSLPSRVFFYAVEGNKTIPDNRILEAAQSYGISFGSFRRQIRSESLKNGLLEALPELQWAGINTYGSRGVITVRERSKAEITLPECSVSHIIASRDGIIISCTVTNGSAACGVGQAVLAGDLLISGYTDCGITIKAERATGEIFAKTQRNLEVVTLPNQGFKRRIGDTEVKFSLLIGKKRINFYKGSGISGSSCDKMYLKYVLTLPGGFALPLALVKEAVSSTAILDGKVDDAEALLRNYSASYLNSQMVVGLVLDQTDRLIEEDGLIKLNSVYGCIESIGKVQEEMNGDFDGKVDRTDR